MTIDHLEFYVEERSMEEVLKILLPTILNNVIQYEIYTFNGKTDLLKNLPDRFLVIKVGFRLSGASSLS